MEDAPIKGFRSPSIDNSIVISLLFSGNYTPFSIKVILIVAGTNIIDLLKTQLLFYSVQFLHELFLQ